MHPKVEIQYFNFYTRPVTGGAIILKFLESEPILQTMDTYELARRQLEIIHEAGGAYDDVKDVHMIFSGAKLYLYGFTDRWSFRRDPDKWNFITNTSFLNLTKFFKGMIKQD